MNRGPGGGLANQASRLMLQSPKDTKRAGGMSSYKLKEEPFLKGVDPGNGNVKGRMSISRAWREDQKGTLFVRGHGCHVG